MKHTSILAIATLAIAPTLGGCGWLVGEFVEDVHRQRAMKKYVYDDDIDDLWEEVVDLADEHGCELPDKPKVDKTVECETDPPRWIRIDERSKGHQVRIEVEHVRTRDGREIKRRSRDFDLEWKLLDRLHPDDAQAIEAEAEEHGRKAKKATRDLDESLDESAR